MRSIIALCLLMLLFACKSDSKSAKLDANYKSEFETYTEKLQQNRIKYLQLNGLHKLKDNDNSFGKGALNHFVMNIESIAETVGTITVKSDSVSFKAAENVMIKTASDSLVTDLHLPLDEYGSSIKLFHNDINWQVITRAGSLYLRVWYENNPMVERFKGYEHYELNSDFIFDGFFSYYDKEKEEKVDSQLGVKTSTNFIGYVTFDYEGNSYQLDVGSSGFTMVNDETSGDDTYGGGRYVYLDLPEQDGKVTIDFNKLYNPPCSFSQFTTCLYPPQQNHLPFKVTAGETLKRL
ncbi:MAG: DUF1684 domain-containing protein [Flavobacteriaceae bacterium]|nr:DUF1684 domain-containing protein [Flavobacteriaceae bacterium]